LEARNYALYAMVCRSAISLLIFALAIPATAKTATHNRLEATRLEKLPTDFVENRGQWNSSAKFVARNGEWTATLEKKALKVGAGRGGSPSVRLVFENASDKVKLAGEGKREGRYNFFIGNDPERRQVVMPAFQSVMYRDIYLGIDARVRDDAGRLEYGLLLWPGADLKKVVVRAEGATALELAGDGALLIKAGKHTVRQSPPKTWETLPDGRTAPVECGFRKISDRRYGFVTPKRDVLLPMTIDHVLEWSIFVGGAGSQNVKGIDLARKGSGEMVLTAQTESSGFPRRNGGDTPVRQTPYMARLLFFGSCAALILLCWRNLQQFNARSGVSTGATSQSSWAMLTQLIFRRLRARTIRLPARLRRRLRRLRDQVQVARKRDRFEPIPVAPPKEFALEATRSNASAMLKAYVTSSNGLIGAMTGSGGGSFTICVTWSCNPQNVSVRGTLGVPRQEL
jgi:hypothetical protein